MVVSEGELGRRRGRKEDAIEGRTGLWEIVVGMEVHARIASEEKLFSWSRTDFGGEPNTRTDFVDAAFPGMLPVLNLRCMELAARMGLALEGRVNLDCWFDRKHYFYPDLPQGYQITQQGRPLVEGGAVRFDVGEREVEVEVERLHVEQDAGKSVHDRFADATGVDLNRAGTGLMEIVSRPDIRSSSEGQAYLRTLRALLRRVKSSDADMEKGSMRADVNVSVRRWGEGVLGTRCEVKNVNSMRFAGRAIESEARRQIEVLEGGGEVEQRTMLFDERSGSTRPMRSKEDAHDYRYFPDPDLPRLELSEGWLEEIRVAIPELPEASRARYESMGLGRAEATALSAEEGRGERFEKAAEVCGDAALAARWELGEAPGEATRLGVDWLASAPSGERLGELLLLLKEGRLAAPGAKEALALMLSEGLSASEAAERGGLWRMGGGEELEGIVSAALEENEEQARKAKEKPALAGWFVGKVMEKTKGSADPKEAMRLVRRALGL